MVLAQMASAANLNGGVMKSTPTLASFPARKVVRRPLDRPRHMKIQIKRDRAKHDQHPPILHEPPVVWKWKPPH